MRQSDQSLSTKLTSFAAYSKYSKVTAMLISALAFSEITPAQTQTVELEEVLVSARRVSESLQETPISVSALSGDEIELRNIQSVADVTNFVPNVQFDSVASESGGGSSSQISIRGIGQTDYTITVEPGVGLYLDGVYIGKSVGSLQDAVDLESIEVLRGPQGTLFGRNTIGGAILLKSKKPTDEQELSMEITAGEFSRGDVKVIGNLPITDTFKVRGTIADLNRDGHVDRVLTGDTQGNKNATSARIVADWDISDTFRSSFAVDASRSREETPGGITFDIDEASFFASLTNTIAFPACAPGGDPARFSNPDCANSQYVRDIDSLETTNTGPNQSDSDIYGFSATLDWDLDDIQIKSITAYRDVQVDVLQQLTPVPTYQNVIGQDISLELFSQEFQLTGLALNDRLNYIVGAYIGLEEGSQVFKVNLEAVQFTSGGVIDNTSMALFGQVGYDLTDKLSLTVGARFSDEDKDYTPKQQIDNVPDVFQPFYDTVLAPIGFIVQEGLPLFPEVKVNRSDTEFTPSVTLDYRFTDSTFAYATYSQGFKAGGFTLRGFPPVIPGVTTPETDPNALIPGFGPETAEVFEIGLKTEFFDNRVRLNLALFQTDYQDLQLTANAGVSAFVPILINAGDADITGFEAEAIVLPTDWLRLDFSLGILDSEYTRLSAEALATGITLDTELPNAPETTATFGATVDFFNNDSGHLFLRTDVSYKDSQFKEVNNNPLLFQDSYSIVNAALTYQAATEKWQATLGATNLGDETYIISGVANAGLGYVQGTASRPSEWYLSFKYNFE